ncbi:hypothetical protein GCM10023081_09170 [Arthrobacter ginkgonis]|uniref:Flagellar hook-associated protein 2 n=1 Tax=Arthrobacter ginkgonis TaxID=1630594 RepID=A0ABP7BXS3_9MICC
MSFAIDGLASGLKSSEMIDAVMDVQSIPQTLLKNKITAGESQISVLRSLNSRIADLATLAKKTTAAGAFSLFTATSSATGIKATAGATATEGSVSLRVEATATRHSAVTAAKTAWSGTELTITDGSGTATSITAASTSMDDVVKAVNAAGAGVTASKVAAGTDAGTGEPLYRLQFTATESGAANSFTVTSGGADVFAEPGAAIVTQGSDAQVLLYAGTAAETRLTSTTNTFTGILQGVDITVAAGTAAGTVAEVAVARDTEAVSSKAKDLVDALNGVFNLISAKTAVSGSNNSLSANVLTGDSAVRRTNEALFKAAAEPINGRSPSEYGITVTRYGTLEFDADKFAAAFEADPAAVESVVNQISARVESVATATSDKYDGALTAKITGQEKLIGTWGDQVEAWDTRLAQRRAQLERIYASLEVTMSNMQAQSTWLSSQIAALPTASTSS